MWTRFTERSRRAVHYGQEEARQRNLRVVEPEHLLLGLMRDKEMISYQLLAECGCSPEAVSETLCAALAREDVPPGKVDFELSDGSKRAIDWAYYEARQLDSRYIGTEHLLLGILTLHIPAIQKVFASFNGSPDAIRQKLRDLTA
jgi:ATP-dependent Clp protease ATP-binding subunit ClpC